MSNYFRGLGLIPVTILVTIGICLFVVPRVQAADDHVAVIDMEMAIFPGTSEYLRSVIDEASNNGAKALVVNLDTPGGMLQTAQAMVKMLYDSPIPVYIYVSPTGSTATSAGVFITMAGHVAAMAPGTTIGAAHPVSGDGSNIQSDMRAKAENMTVAMAKSISEQRSRNASWAEKAVKESASITEIEAIKIGVVDIVAKDVKELLKNAKGKKVKIGDREVILEDYSLLPIKSYEISFKQKFINTISDPNIVQLLWLAATTGLSIELYNPGAILPGVVGVICLILGLASYQIIPINIGGILLLACGALMIGLEMFIPSGVLGVGGIIAIVLGSIYLVDVSAMPGVSVNLGYILFTSVFMGGLVLLAVRAALKAQSRRKTTGQEGLVGLRGQAVENISETGRIFVNGEYWQATCPQGIIEKGAEVEVVKVKPGMVLEIKKIS